jgi:hypothetical protein
MTGSHIGAPRRFREFATLVRKSCACAMNAAPIADATPISA